MTEPTNAPISTVRRSLIGRISLWSLPYQHHEFLALRSPSRLWADDDQRLRANTRTPENQIHTLLSEHLFAGLKPCHCWQALVSCVLAGADQLRVPVRACISVHAGTFMPCKCMQALALHMETHA
jgi:hypothetical protein